ncbi:MAG: hypothetical protein JSR46_10770, partial [Verrucomicrobia bacterium]|nr:hypothetical protein [Verrucomicrobiota bacterium]
MNVPEDLFSPIDTLTAEAVQKALRDTDEDVFLLIKYLSAVFRMGHL